MSFKTNRRTLKPFPMTRRESRSLVDSMFIPAKEPEPAANAFAALYHRTKARQRREERGY